MTYRVQVNLGTEAKQDWQDIEHTFAHMSGADIEAHARFKSGAETRVVYTGKAGAFTVAYTLTKATHYVDVTGKVRTWANELPTPGKPERDAAKAAQDMLAVPPGAKGTGIGATPKLVGTIDLTPTWTNMLPVLLVLLENGSDTAQATAKEQLATMAKAADRYNEGAKNGTINLTPHEKQSGVDRVWYAEGLIRQLPEDHEGRNTWLMHYGRREG